MSIPEVILLVLIVISIVISVFTMTRLASLRREINDYRVETNRTVSDSFSSFSNMLYNSQMSTVEVQNQRLMEMNERFRQMQEENGKQLEEIRVMVDEKLQKTLDERLGQSFQAVSQRLDQVSKGLGEMQSLASGVGDLKKVLSNVKTRGILGEVQLGAILSEILPPEQYAENVNTAGIGNNTVEFAVRLPGDGDTPVWLPIDSKFPGDSYAKLVDAYDSGDKAAVTAAQRGLIQMIRKEAKDIHEKYISPPATTSFGILFLPFEGLYAEVVRLGMIEQLQRDYNVNIAGPTTMAALLNSLQMGFRTLAIQKRSGEVWQVLGAVKTELGNFESVLQKAQKNLNQANNNLETLIGVRTRAMQRRLKDVTELPGYQADRMLDLEEGYESLYSMSGDKDDE